MNTKEQIIELVPALIRLNKNLARRNQSQKHTIISQGGIIHHQNEALDHAKKVIADLKSEIETLRAANWESEKAALGIRFNAIMEHEDDGLTIPAFN